MVNNIQVGEPHMNEGLVGEDEIKDIHSGNVLVWDRNNARLPKAYQEVEYIESNGNQYINSGYIANYNSKFYVKFSHNEHVIDTPIFGARRTSSNENEWVLWSHPSNYSGGTGNSQFRFNSTQVQSIGSYAENTIIEFEYNNTKWKYGSNGGTYSGVSSSGTSTYNVIIFGLQNGGSVDSRKFSGKMWSFKIRENDNLVRNFVPCYRKSDNVIGLYDLVNKQFYTNAGSGAFTKGPNI